MLRAKKNDWLMQRRRQKLFLGIFDEKPIFFYFRSTFPFFLRCEQLNVCCLAVNERSRSDRNQLAEIDSNEWWSHRWRILCSFRFHCRCARNTEIRIGTRAMIGKDRILR